MWILFFFPGVAFQPTSPTFAGRRREPKGVGIGKRGALLHSPHSGRPLRTRDDIAHSCSCFLSPPKKGPWGHCEMYAFAASLSSDAILKSFFLQTECCVQFLYPLLAAGRPVWLNFASSCFIDSPRTEYNKKDVEDIVRNAISTKHCACVRAFASASPPFNYTTIKEGTYYKISAS